MPRLVWTKNHYSNRVRDDGPTGSIELEQIWRVTVKHGDNPPERQDFDREDMARHRVTFLKAKLGGTWEGGDGPGHAGDDASHRYPGGA